MSAVRCEEVVREIPLYCYGEVSSALEERMEAHFAECESCRAALARHRAFLEILDQRPDASDEMASETPMLASCRSDLRAAVAAEAERARNSGWTGKIREILDIHIPFRIPVGAMALFAAGWLAAHYAPARFGGMQTDASEPMFSTVRSIEPDSSGRVQIAVDDVRRHVVAGRLQDPRIQDLLLSAAREEANPGVRVESIDVLQQASADSTLVEQALLDAVSRDPNAAVRLKAVEGLRQFGGDPVVRKALADVLLKDDAAGVRVRAIDLLSAHHDDSIVGVLQDVIQKEDNSYVRAHTRDLLEAMRASVGTY